MKDNEKFIQEMYASSLERTIKRLWITIILLIVLLVGSNVAWIWYESQFENVTQTIEAEQEGNTNSVTMGDGNTYGKAESNDNHNN